VSPAWSFDASLPLPEGHSLLLLEPVAAELGDQRLHQAVALLGRETALTAAAKAGSYELDEELARRLALEGVELGEGGRIPALSPPEWGRHPEAHGRASFVESLMRSGGELRGLRLGKGEEESFRRFLSRNRVSEESEPGFILELARHFFFSEPLNVVVRYTGPRFARP
jgi:hypothetical protein